jgi:hypothetical protein
MMKRTLMAASAALLVAGLAACGGGSDDPVPAPSPIALGDTVALTASGRLISFNRATPGNLTGSVAITGTGVETLLGLDVRPADGRLYALGSAGNLYTVEPTTGVATLRTALKPTAGDDNPYTALAGTDFGVDFNPVADRLRVVSSTGLNLRINVDSGEVITDGAIALQGGVTSVAAAGYTNAFAGAVSTALYDLDAAGGLLHLQDPPNNGTLAAGVTLGVAASAVNGFDIDARTNTGYAALAVGSSVGLYSVNLTATAGAATRIGDLAGGEAIRGLALLQPAAPTVVGLTSDNRLVAFDPKAPNTLTSTVAITGLAAGESVIGIDVRPADRQLYALTSAGRLYTVNPGTGAATAKSTLAADPADTTAPYAGLLGPVFSVDFNPAADRLRVIGSQGQNLRINVDTGATTTDGEINRTAAAPAVLAAAYTNSFAAAPSTVLFNLEGNRDVLTRQDPPNNGTLVDVGPLGLDITGAGGFDIAGGANGLVLAALRSGSSGPFSLYTVSLTTGALSLYRNTGAASLSQIGGASGPELRDIAILF